MTLILNNILERFSSPKMVDIKLSDIHIKSIIQAGMAANDHGNLKPWRFQVYKYSGRERLANAFVQHEKENNNILIKKAADSCFRSPVIICVIASPIKCKIPKRDQLFSAAAVCQLMTLMAHNLNVASIWRTGKYAESKIVKKHLKISANEEIVGFIYLGGYEDKKNSHKRHKPRDFINEKISIFQ